MPDGELEAIPVPQRGRPVEIASGERTTKLVHVHHDATRFELYRIVAREDIGPQRPAHEEQRLPHRLTTALTRNTRPQQ
jgi:hypothetical protein